MNRLPQFTRQFSLSFRRFNNVFGEITQIKETPVIPETETEVETKDLSPKDDKNLQEFYLNEVKAKAITEDKFITPLKRELYNLNVKQNGFFKNNQIINHQNKNYKVSLTEKEIELLEPTIFLQSGRIKSSMKKATVVNRFVRGFNVKTAINQLHFNPKKMSTELEKLLKTGLEHAKVKGIHEDKLYIQQLWVGSDGEWRKRLDPKGRGRMGIINHKYIHLKCILKSTETKRRLEWENSLKDQAKKPKTGLINQPLNFRNVPFYKW
ncbi:54S ribosomal protein L22, mitochondrial [[Candida] jaroonii]|uniref:54S ribosomal protein L22, mitochondrial n=1 Tax=[Candida] jaroonii TaxID=467808 RepID=A0ACA9YG53_9ASCO|nr:54S ribosomal protein L22, mitochondrial [[Candida] jaroonii]